METIDQLVQISSSQRDAKWEKQLLEVFAESSLFLKTGEPFQGPDGYSYVAVSSEGEEKVDIKDLLNWCFESGVGLVFNLKENKAPDFVFTYGMIWNYLLRGTFVNEMQEESVEDENQTFVHEISEGFLPLVVRSHMKEFLKNNGLEKVKLSLLSQGAGSFYQLVFFIESFQGDESAGKTLMEAISWFLPGNYHLGLVPEEFEELKFQAL